MRFTIFVSFALLTMAFIIIFSQLMLQTYKRKALEQKTNFTVNQSNILLNQLVSYGYFNGESNLNLENQIDQLATLFDGRIMIVNSDYQILTDTYQLNRGKYLISADAIKAMSGLLTESENYQIKDGYIQCYIPVSADTEHDGEAVQAARTAKSTKKQMKNGRNIGLMVVSTSIKDTDTTLAYVKQQNRAMLTVFGLCVLIVAVIITMVLTGHFRDFTESINAIAEGRANEAVVIHGFTEMKDIAKAFNNEVERLDKLEESRQEFVSNVSHELKTPITSMKVLADSLLTQENVPPEVYREFMEDIVDEIDRENKIINDLLSLVKLDRKTDNVLNVTTVNINELLELLLKRLRPLAVKRNIEIVYESFRTVSAEIDEVKLTLALSNLVENAIKYNKEDGWVRVTLNADHKYFYVKIADSGIGIPKECQEQVFQRFYRVDKARSRDTGGTGLGLAITHSAVAMHHGSIKLHSIYGEGTTFTVRIPLTYSVNVYSGVLSQAKSEHRKFWKHEENRQKNVPTPTVVPIKNVSEVQGNLGEVIHEVKQNLEKNKESDPAAGGTTVVEPAPPENVEPEMVVLHTDEMDSPEVVMLQQEETKTEAEQSDSQEADTAVKTETNDNTLQATEERGNDHA